MSDALRLYEPGECGPDGYPVAWHESVKDAVREQAGHRCVRCGHPYLKGEHGKGEWSPCDERCEHAGPLRASESGVSEDLSHLYARGLLEAGFRVEAAWRILTVHHLNGVKSDLRWWNLAALCQRCHLTIQGRVQMERVYPWPHTDWFKPYAAGWYAYAYLGENLTRAQVDARLDDLLGLELA